MSKIQDKQQVTHKETKKRMATTLKATGAMLLASSIAVSGVLPSFAPDGMKTIAAKAAPMEAVKTIGDLQNGEFIYKSGYKSVKLHTGDKASVFLEFSDTAQLTKNTLYQNPYINEIVEPVKYLKAIQKADAVRSNTDLALEYLLYKNVYVNNKLPEVHYRDDPQKRNIAYLRYDKTKRVVDLTQNSDGGGIDILNSNGWYPIDPNYDSYIFSKQAKKTYDYIGGGFRPGDSNVLGWLKVWWTGYKNGTFANPIEGQYPIQFASLTRSNNTEVDYMTGLASYDVSKPDELQLGVHQNGGFLKPEVQFYNHAYVYSLPNDATLDEDTDGKRNVELDTFSPEAYPLKQSLTYTGYKTAEDGRFDLDQLFATSSPETTKFNINIDDENVASANVAQDSSNKDKFSNAHLIIKPKAAGKTKVHVTLEDKNGITTEQVIDVTVKDVHPYESSTDSSEDVVYSGVSKDIDLDNLLLGGTDTIYTVKPQSGVGSVTATLNDNILTVKGGSIGKVNVLVTATNEVGTKNYTLSLEVRPYSEYLDKSPIIVKEIPNQAVKVGKTAEFNLAEYFSDEDGDALTYTATTSDDHDSEVWVAPGNILKFRANYEGSYRVTVRANDGIKSSEPLTFTVNATTTGGEVTNPSNPGDSGTEAPQQPTSYSAVENVNIDTMNTDYKISVKPLFNNIDLSKSTFEVTNTNDSTVTSSFDEESGILTLQGLKKGFSSVAVKATDDKQNKSTIMFLVYSNPTQDEATPTEIKTAPMMIANSRIMARQQVYSVPLNKVYGDVVEMKDVKDYLITIKDKNSVADPLTLNYQALQMFSVRTLTSTKSVAPPTTDNVSLEDIISQLPEGVEAGNTTSSSKMKATVINNNLLLEGVEAGESDITIQPILKNDLTLKPVSFTLTVDEPEDVTTPQPPEEGTDTGSGSDNSGSTGNGSDNGGSGSGSDNGGSTGNGSDNGGSGSGSDNGGSTGDGSDNKVDLNKDLTSDQYQDLSKNADKDKTDQYNENKKHLGDNATKEDIETIIDLTNNYGDLNPDKLPQESILDILDQLPKDNDSAFHDYIKEIEKALDDKTESNTEAKISFKNFAKLVFGAF